MDAKAKYAESDIFLLKRLYIYIFTHISLVKSARMPRLVFLAKYLCYSKQHNVKIEVNRLIVCCSADFMITQCDL